MSLPDLGNFISEEIPYRFEKGCRSGCGKALIVIGLIAASGALGYCTTTEEFSRNVTDIILPSDTGTPVSSGSENNDFFLK